jgi:hypothetical protein
MRHDLAMPRVREQECPKLAQSFIFAQELSNDSSGGQVDVQLDESFNVVSQTADHEGADDQDGANDD